jgi:hypothetical protein
MHIILKPSPSVAHKYRVILPNHRFVDFGTKTERDYTDHKNPRLMRARLLRHGAVMSRKVRTERDPSEIHREMLRVCESRTEDWDDMFSEEYWNRWLLFTYPTVHQAKLFMTMRQGVLFMPTAEGFWYL